MKVFLSVLMLYVSNSYSSVSLGGDCKIINELRKVVFAVQTIMKRNDAIAIQTCGTGFLSYNKHGDVYGVTCRHVVEQLEKKQIFAALDTDSGLIRFAVKVIFVDDKLDFAILGINGEGKIRTLSFSNNNWPDSDIVLPGKTVVNIGYPLGLGIGLLQNSPIIRSGMVAQEIITSHFLIDGIVNPGNSGSPVFSIEDGKVIGMIIAYRTDNMFINSHEKIINSIPYNSGLSIAIDAKMIKKQLDSLPKYSF